MMISVEQAVSLVLEHAVASDASISVPLHESLGRVLADNVHSDRDSPPYDKSLVDGYAIRSEDAEGDTPVLRVVEQVCAGDLPSRAVLPGTATCLMTGAPIPEGADAVVMLEQTDRLDGDPPRVRLRPGPVSAGQNILRRAASMACGQLVVTAGGRLRPIEIGLLAEVGRTDVPVRPLPRVALLATGNELVAPDRTPGPGQIRNSNGPMIAALVRRACAWPHDLGIAPDDETTLRERMTVGLRSDMLLLSGGVSAGVKDLVPRVLRSLGAEPVFHGVDLKPGKPVWFGFTPPGRGDANLPTLIFGLPGNPVSCLVCFLLLVQPAIQRIAGLRDPRTVRLRAKLCRPHTSDSNRPTYHPARIYDTSDGLVAEPLAWLGSADLATLAAADGVILFPEQRRYQTHEELTVHLWP